MRRISKQREGMCPRAAFFGGVLLHGFPACGSFFSLDKVGAFCYSEGKEMTDIRDSNREQYVCRFPKRENDF